MAALGWVEALHPAVQIVAVLGAMVGPLLAVVVRTRMRIGVERERTRRLAQSISGVPSARRADVLRAQATVEASYVSAGSRSRRAPRSR